MQENTTPKKKKMSTWIKVVLGFFGVLFALSLIGKFASPPPQASETQPEANSSEIIMSDTLKAELAVIEAQEKKEALANLPALKKKFNFKKDEFKEIGWYTHKNQVGATRTTLLAHVNDKGFVYLESQYHQDGWIFHDHVQVKIGETILTTPTIPRSSENNMTEVADGVWENVHYLEGADAIMMMIELNPKKTVKVRFQGKQHYHDMTLSEKDITAIADAMRLSNAIKRAES